MCKASSRTNNICCKCVARVEVCWARWLTRINDADSVTASRSRRARQSIRLGSEARRGRHTLVARTERTVRVKLRFADNLNGERDAVANNLGDRLRDQ